MTTPEGRDVLASSILHAENRLLHERIKTLEMQNRQLAEKCTALMNIEDVATTLAQALVDNDSSSASDGEQIIIDACDRSLADDERSDEEREQSLEGVKAFISGLFDPPTTH